MSTTAEGNDRAPGETVHAPFLVADRDAVAFEAIGAVVPDDDLVIRHDGLPQRGLGFVTGTGAASWAFDLDVCGPQPGAYVFCSFASSAARPTTGAAASRARSLSRFSLRCRRRWISVG